MESETTASGKPEGQIQIVAQSHCKSGSWVVTIRHLLSRFVDPDQVEILRSLVYTFNALNADEWINGRVILAGDAAHMTPQFMGQA